MPNLKSSKKPNLDQDVIDYKDLAAKIKFFSEKQKAVRDRIEAAVTKIPEGKIITPEYAIVLTVCERETFSLKDAKAVLGEAKLKPFMSSTVYTQLRVT